MKINWTKNMGTTVVRGINLRLNFQPTLEYFDGLFLYPENENGACVGT